ncbi:hypothetical protein [Streptomyces sp. NPDC058572]|uniref:hypothetical protein n=1 Tax=Streptomyces sp. NPDC058572 TaxID=3346546 RepID=UPI003661B7AF
MPGRGERKQRVRTQPERPAPESAPDRLGARTIVAQHRNGPREHGLDPASFRCVRLAGELADEWIAYTRAMALRRGGPPYLGGIRSFARFVDRHLPTLGLDPADARLSGGPVDWVEVFYAWEGHLRQRHGLQSNQPYTMVSALLTLLAQRAQREPGSLPAPLVKRTEAPPTYPLWTGEPLDEFSNAERLWLRDAARRDVRELEARLRRGREMLAAGEDPRETTWHRPENLVWATHARLINSQSLFENLPKHRKRWPAEIDQMVPDQVNPTAVRRKRAGRAVLGRTLAGLLFPAEVDLNAFRVLLLLEMADTTPEELLDLRVSELEFSDAGVRLVQRKNRASRVRADLHPASEGPEEDFIPGAGVWDIPGLLKRLIAVTELSREVFPEADPWLFLAVKPRGKDGVLEARQAAFDRDGNRFTHWIASHRDDPGEPVEISLPHETRRLRKTAKTVRAVALGGTVSDLAGDDHHVEVYRGHYAHGTTARVLAGQTINRVQQWVFQRATDGPVMVTAKAEAQLDHPQTCQDLHLEPEQAKAMREGELDMGLSNCRDPYASPFTPDGKLCHVAPAMCLLCRNAVVFTSQLPRLLMLADHIERMRAALPPPHWHALWGRQATALKQLFEECADLLPAARAEIVERGLRLDLPLGLRTEYDR